MRKETEFRSWLKSMWEENCREHETFNESPYAMSEYFIKYKYWLKREFRFQRSR